MFTDHTRNCVRLGRTLDEQKEQSN